MANWLETYAEALEIDIWLSSMVSKATYSEKHSIWDVTVERAGKPERQFQVKHVVFATGLGEGKGATPDIKGREAFKGQVLHSMQLKRASEHVGKKVVVVGACTSGENIISTSNSSPRLSHYHSNSP
jgi:cation diffusion facilitator CzcD-associated flavoprotein CzcO